MEKSPLEKALEQVPSYKQMQDAIGDTTDFPEVYKALRSVEKAYEQLQQAGVNVQEQLTERRYQIAEMVTEVIHNDLDILHNYLKDRVREGKPDEAGGDVEAFYQTAAGNISKLGEYLGKIYAGNFGPVNEKKANELFPEPNYK